MTIKVAFWKFMGFNIAMKKSLNEKGKSLNDP